MLLAILIAFTAWLFSFFMPWWSVVIPGFIFGAWIGTTKSYSFNYGFLGIAGLWLFETLSTNYYNTGILVSRIADLLEIHGSFWLIIITVFFGGLLGALSSLTGFLFRETFFNNG